MIGLTSEPTVKLAVKQIENGGARGITRAADVMMSLTPSLSTHRRLPLVLYSGLDVDDDEKLCAADPVARHSPTGSFAALTGVVPALS